MARSIKELAAEAIAVQNACNPLGVSKGYAAGLQELADKLREVGEPCGTRDICNHPIHRLWASKVHDLAGMGLSDCDRYGEAYDACQKLAG